MSVELLHYMGDDLMVANAARVSFNKESAWADGKPGQVADKDASLINYLAKHGHWSPFAHPQLQFRIKMPLIIANQWFKHVVGFVRNSVSRRYVSYEPEIFYPKTFRQSSLQIKQGSLMQEVEKPQECERLFQKTCQNAVKAYNELLASGVAPEQARMVLPQAMYTEFIETASLQGYARLCQLRLDEHSQKEIRDYAAQIEKLIYKKFPVSWSALMSCPVAKQIQLASDRAVALQ
ncbi:FAD-dependent thymidylate synthase [Candidatus Babeliales bacterium]|nr:FAD-dependent thymidylate synthase [Candidatus Babeliales bacterium]